MENQKPGARYRNLDLNNMAFAFVALGIGLGLAALNFVLEFFYHKCGNKKKVEEQQRKLPAKTVNAESGASSTAAPNVTVVVKNPNLNKEPNKETRRDGQRIKKAHK